MDARKDKGIGLARVRKRRVPDGERVRVGPVVVTTCASIGAVSRWKGRRLRRLGSQSREVAADRAQIVLGSLGRRVNSEVDTACDGWESGGGSQSIGVGEAPAYFEECLAAVAVRPRRARAPARLPSVTGR